MPVNSKRLASFSKIVPISKMIPIIIIKTFYMKRGIENGLRLELNLSIPHSKALQESRMFSSIHKDKA
jgi:hypothetical protein